MTNTIIIIVGLSLLALIVLAGLFFGCSRQPSRHDIERVASMTIAMDDQSVAQRVLDHIANGTTDVGREVWHEPVGVVGQIVDVISAIGEHSLVTVDVANAGCGSDNPFQSFGGVQARNAGHGSSLAMRMDLCCPAAQKRSGGATFFYTPNGRRFPNAHLAWKCPKMCEGRFPTEVSK